MKENIIPHLYQVSLTDRRKINKHNSFLLWFTGLSGSGKSTIANALEHKLHQEGVKTSALDGDNIRKGINNVLSFSIQISNIKKDEIEMISSFSFYKKLNYLFFYLQN